MGTQSSLATNHIGADTVICGELRATDHLQVPIEVCHGAEVVLARRHSSLHGYHGADNFGLPGNRIAMVQGTSGSAMCMSIQRSAPLPCHVSGELVMLAVGLGWGGGGAVWTWSGC